MFSTGFNTIATNPVSGPLLQGREIISKDPVSPGHAPYDLDTGKYCMFGHSGMILLLALFLTFVTL